MTRVMKQKMAAALAAMFGPGPEIVKYGTVA